MKLRIQIQQLAHTYSRKGGKKNRRQQVSRMLAFAAHVESEGIYEIGQVGKKQVISYWRSLRAAGGLADSTLYSHWLAIRELWQLTGRSEEPPQPFKSEKIREENDI